MVSPNNDVEAGPTFGSSLFTISHVFMTRRSLKPHDSRSAHILVLIFDDGRVQKEVALSVNLGRRRQTKTLW